MPRWLLFLYDCTQVAEGLVGILTLTLWRPSWQMGLSIWWLERGGVRPSEPKEE